MYGSIPAGNDKMLNEELNIENLAERVNKAKRIIEVTILSLDKDMNKNSNQLKRIEQICGVPIREESCFGY